MYSLATALMLLTAATPAFPQVAIYTGPRSFLGVAVVEVTNGGVEISRVEDDSPAAKAGLKVGDIVTEYNSQKVIGTEQFVRLVRETPPNREVQMQVTRGGQSMQLRATIGTRKSKAVELGELPRVEIPDMPRALVNWRSPMLGVEAESLNSQLADYFGVKEGVLVRAVSTDSTAEKAGLKAGDVITKVEDKKVTSPSEVTSAIRSLDRKTFTITIVRDKREQQLSVTMPEDEVLRPRGRTIRLPQDFKI